MQAENLVEKLRNRRSRLLDPESGALTAAVAVLLRAAVGGTELLFLQRAQRKGDPWSGHVSFPGGKIDASDVSPRHTAIRETREETAIDLDYADFVCRLDDQATHLGKVHVAGFVFYLANGSDPTLNHEIRNAFWLPLADLMDENRYVTTTVEGEWGAREVCAIDLLDGEGPVLWGLTYRFTAQVLACAGHELPGGSEVQLR
ncbi:MAG: CoA pyrophosphatase [Gemmatimonadetes bacterium]|nr:CoA pyrophosphatase [Gemmatimonadota bacterium]MYG85603.1 CoA pyrophosphatase [Gemmatimonadota bacterium]MYJ90440.1 CoA pyrophosphatase [Gemmatimonadota bacterium]